jgi:hypothetical protein
MNQLKWLMDDSITAEADHKVCPEFQKREPARAISQ